MPRFASLGNSVIAALGDFDEEELDNMEWAFGRAGCKKVVKALQQRKKASGLGGMTSVSNALDVPKCGQMLDCIACASFSGLPYLQGRISSQAVDRKAA